MDTIRKLYYFVDPLQRLSALGEQKRQIDRDQIRTAFEKKTELERLSQQKQAMYNTVRTALQNDWGVLKSQYQQLRCEKTAAADRSARRWEYPRLEYARKDARQFLQSASLPAVMRRYKEIELSGDTHALRGFVEDAINVIGNERKFSEQDSIRVTDMRTEFEKMYNDLTITPEMRDLAKQGETLTGKVRAVYEATDRAKREFVTVDSMGTLDNAFDQMTKGVHVKVRVDPTNLAEITEVDLDWD